MSPALLAVLAVSVAVILVLLWILAVTNRIDRLHIRTDAAWAALDSALARRAVVARAVATGLGGRRGALLHQAGEEAERASRQRREAAENELGRHLAELPRQDVSPALLTELDDAEQRVVIARRVHNDAVRDTLVQRRRRIVRWLRFAGTAPCPRYFEIAESVAAAEATQRAVDEPHRDAG